MPSPTPPIDELPAITGREFSDPAFVRVGRLGTVGGFRRRPIILRLHLPARTRAARLDQLGSEFAGEREVVLPRHTRWFVHRVP